MIFNQILEKARRTRQSLVRLALRCWKSND